MTTSVSRELEFLRECHQVKSKNFDNSERIPQNLYEKYRYAVKDIMQLWRKYLFWKFKYLLALEGNPPVNTTSFAEELQKQGAPEMYLAEFLELWEKKQEAERVTYQYRYSQLPVEIVHAWWYAPNISTCFEWCIKRQKELKTLETEALSKPWETKLIEIYNRMPKEPSTNFYTDWLLASICRHGIQTLAEKINEIHTCLMKSPATLERINEMSVQCQAILNEVQDSIKSLMREYGGFEHDRDNFLANLSVKLVRVLYQEDFDEDAVIRCFLSELKDRFKCEVCDYVDVEDDGNLIVWRTATVNHMDLSPELRELPLEEVRRRVRERESYKKGEGISGTILLQSTDMVRNLWFHVGSNDVLKDPRQSPEHRTAYEKDIYPGVLKTDGKIHNFWMFPIFRAGKLVGAFRVVNKTDSQGNLQVGGWPYFIRLELALIAQWFSKFLEAVQPQILRREDALAFLSWGRRVGELRQKLQLTWVDEKFFTAILRHFVRVISKKEEQRRMGSTVLITKKTPGFPAAYPLREYPMISLNVGEIRYPYGDLDALLDVVDPLLGAFVFDENGEFMRVVNLQYENENGVYVSGYQTIQAITKKYKHSICIMLPRDGQNILFYQDGKEVAELYLHERTGEWKYRLIADIRKILFERTSLKDEKAREVILEALLELSSRRFGALFVLGEIPRDKFTFQTIRKQFQGPTHIVDVGVLPLVELAKLDGATIIDNSGMLISVNTIIHPLEETGDFEIFPDRGSRHQTGEIICKLAPKALVIIVSQNGGISILQNKKALIRDI